MSCTPTRATASSATGEPLSFNAVTEAFLAQHLGGEYEPVGTDFENSSLHVPAGVDGVPGLGEALPVDRRDMPPASAGGAP